MTLQPKNAGFGELWTNSDWSTGSFRAKCLFGIALLATVGFVASNAFETPKPTTMATINPNQQASDLALQESWAAEYNALTDFTRATVAAWDLSQTPDPQRMSFMQMVLENETLQAAGELQKQLTTPGSPCNIAPIRHELACGEGVIQSEVLPEMSAAASGGSRFVLVEMDAATGKEIDRRSISASEVAGANLIRWQGLLRAGAEYPRREFPLNFAQQSQLGTRYLDTIKNRLSLQGVVDYQGTQEAGKNYWQRMNEAMPNNGTVENNGAVENNGDKDEK
ncbi:MAG: hypothetical protein WBB29_19320 [Geitlerinemataceae cyanobacterium]